MGHPERDPHGDPIPSAGEGLDDTGEPITHWQVGQEGRIVHLEDEPAATFSALVHLGLQPSQPFRVLETSPHALHLLMENREIVLPLEHAGNVFVAPLEAGIANARDLVRLSELPLEQEAADRLALANLPGADAAPTAGSRLHAGYAAAAGPADVCRRSAGLPRPRHDHRAPS